MATCPEDTEHQTECKVSGAKSGFIMHKCFHFKHSWTKEDAPLGVIHQQATYLNFSV